MDQLYDELDIVKKILAESPRGMTITDVSEQMGINRNAVAKYLEVLRTAGEIDMKPFGRSKIFTLSSRVPLAMALNLSSEMIVLIDSELNVLDTNDPLLRYTGLCRGQIVGQPLDRVHAGLLAHPNVLLNIKDVLNGAEYVHEISVARGQDQHFFKIKMIPVSMGDVRRRAAIIFENITARKKAEIAMRESEARYRAVAEDHVDMIVRMLPDTTITFVNDAWCRFLNRKRSQLVGTRFLDHHQAMTRAQLESTLARIPVENDIEYSEAVIRMSNGSTRWLQWKCRCIFDEAGCPGEFQIVARDITGVKQTEIALRESEANFRNIFDHAPIGICKMSLDFRFLKVNPEMCHITGYDEAELLARSFPDITCPEDRETSLGMVKAVAGGRGEYYQIDKRYMRKDGSILWARVNGRLIKGPSGEPLYFIAMIEDITDGVNGCPVSHFKNKQCIV